MVKNALGFCLEPGKIERGNKIRGHMDASTGVVPRHEFGPGFSQKSERPVKFGLKLGWNMPRQRNPFDYEYGLKKGFG